MRPNGVEEVNVWPSSIEVSEVQRLAERRSCLLSYSQAEQERELIQPRRDLLAEPCMLIGRKCCPFTIELSVFNMLHATALQLYRKYESESVLPN